MQIKIPLTMLLVWLVSLTLGADEPLLSLDVHNVGVKELLNIISQQARSNIIISEKINGKISVKLTNVSWQNALDTLVKMQGLVKHENNGIIMVTTKEEMIREENLLLQNRLFKLNSTAVDNLAKLLGPSGALSTRGKIGTDPLSNSLIVTDTTEHLNNITKLVNQIDTPTKQIFIEARIVSVDNLFVHELGLEFNAAPNTIKNNHRISDSTLSSQEGQFNFTMARLKNNGRLDLQLAALEKDGRGQIISKPKLLTTNRQSAYIETGSEIPYQEKTTKGNTSIAFKKAVLSLKVTPEILANDDVNLTIEMNQDKVGQLLLNGVPTIDTRKIQTQAMAKNNETIVLGGIYEWNKINTVSGVPILREIPLIKLLCSKQLTHWERKELLIFVTPRIIP